VDVQAVLDGAYFGAPPTPLASSGPGLPGHLETPGPPFRDVEGAKTLLAQRRRPAASRRPCTR
jgi:hypothetical protein